MTIKKHYLWPLLLALLVVPAQAEESVDDIIAHHIETLGGEEALDAVHSMRISGKMNMGGMEVPMTIEQKRPDKVRMDMQIQGMTMTRAYDGEHAWGVMPMMGQTEPDLLGEDERKQLVEMSEFDGPLVDYKEKGHQVELLGKEEVEGTEAYKLKVTRSSGDVIYYYLDSEYYLPFQTESRMKMQGNEIKVTTKLGDYQEVGGILMPYSFEQIFEGAPAGANMQIEKIDVNIELDDSKFTMPPKEEKKEADAQEG